MGEKRAIIAAIIVLAVIASSLPVTSPNRGWTGANAALRSPAQGPRQGITETLHLQGATPQPPPTLIFNSTHRILRVPYYSQDNVGHCWLYSYKMVVEYYGKHFNESEVLRRMHLGYNHGLSFREEKKLWNVLKDLYGIRFKLLKQKSDFINTIEEEIDRYRPVILIVGWSDSPGFHDVVVTGYIKMNGSVYLVINDPSGYLIDRYYIWAKSKRARLPSPIFNTTATSYDFAYPEPHYIIDSSYFKDKDSNVNMLRLVGVDPNSAPPPSPPLASMAFYESYSPYFLAQTPSGSRGVKLVPSRYYVNNPAKPTLWGPLPVAPASSSFGLTGLVCNNAPGPENISVIENIAVHDFMGGTTYGVRARLEEFHLQAGECHHIAREADLRSYVYSGYGEVDLDLEVYDSSGHLLARTETISLRVFPVVYIVTVNPSTEISIAVTEALALLPNGVSKVELFFNITGQPSMRIDSVNIEIPVLGIKRAYTVQKSRIPSPDEGGYYLHFGFDAPSNLSYIHVHGVIIARTTLFWFIPSTKRYEFHVELPLQGILVGVNPYEVTYRAARNNKAEAVVKYFIYNAWGSWGLNVSIRDGSPSAPAALGHAILEAPPGLSLAAVKVPLSRKPSATEVYVVAENPLAKSPTGTPIEASICRHLNPYSLSLKPLLSGTPSASQGGILRVLVNVTGPPLSATERAYYGVSFDAYIDGRRVEAVSMQRAQLGGQSFYGLYIVEVRVPRGLAPGNHSLRLVPVIVSKATGCRAKALDVGFTLQFNVVKPTPAGGGRVALVIVLDKSGSMDDLFRGMTKLDWAKQAAAILVNLSLDGDLLGLVAFDSYPSVLFPLTPMNSTTKRELIEALDQVEAEGTTDIGDSMLLAASMLEKACNVTARAMVLLTDGMHNTGTDPIDALNRIKGSGIVIFTIGLGEPGDYDEDLLKMIAAETGGKYYYAPTPDMLAEIFASIRKVVESTPLIDSQVIRLAPGKSAELAYQLVNPFPAVVDISWSGGASVDAYLNISGIIVSASNASKVGVDVTRPTPNTIRFVIKSGGLLKINTTFTLSRIPFGVIVANSPQSPNTTVRVDLYSSNAVPLLLSLSRSTGRFYSGEPIFVQVRSVRGLSVEALLVDDNGVVESTMLYDDGLHGDVLPDDGIYGGVLVAPQQPGQYVIVARALRAPGLPARATVVPVVVKPVVRPPVQVVVSNRTYMLLSRVDIPVQLNITKPSIVRVRAIVEPHVPLGAPRVMVLPGDVIDARRPGTYSIRIHVVRSPYTPPGRYNLSLIVSTDEGSQTARVALEVVDASVKAYTGRLEVITSPGGQATARLRLAVSAGALLNLTIYPLAGFNLSVGGSRVATLSVKPGRRVVELPITARAPARLGIEAGSLQILLGNQTWDVVPVYMIVVPAGVNVSTIKWGAAPDSLVLAGRGLKLSITGKPVALGYLASLEGGGFVVYASGDAELSIDPLALGVRGPARIEVTDLSTGRTSTTISAGTALLNLKPGAYRVVVQGAMVTTTVTKTTTTTITITITSVTTSIKTLKPKTVVKTTVQTVPVPFTLTETQTTTRTTTLTVLPRASLIGVGLLLAALVIAISGLIVVGRRSSRMHP